MLTKTFKSAKRYNKIRLVVVTREIYKTQTIIDVVKHANEQVRADIMDTLGNKTTTVIPAKHVAAMKVTENIPWNLLDDIRRWISEAKDSRRNLCICLERFKAHIDKLAKQNFHNFYVLVQNVWLLWCCWSGRHPCV